MRNPAEATGTRAEKAAGIPFLRTIQPGSGTEFTARFQLAVLRLGLLGLVCLIGCAKPASPPEDILAEVGASKITLADFNAELQRRLGAGTLVPSKEALLQEMILNETLLQKARAEGLEKDPEVRRVYEKLLIGKLKERELEPRLKSITVSKDEIEEAYRERINQYSNSAKVRLAIIYIQSNPAMSQAKLAELQSRIEEAHKLARDMKPGSLGFGDVARRFSEDQTTRYKGGDIGWIDLGKEGYRWPQEVLNAGFALKSNGEVSDVITTPRGFYLVSRLDSREGSATPLDHVADNLRRKLLAAQRANVEESFRREIAGAVSVKVHSNLLSQVEFPVSAVAKRSEPSLPALP